MTGRDRQILRAVSEGRGQVIVGCGDVLTINGLPCADQSAALRLMWGGYIGRPAGKFGQRVRAEITELGRTELTVAGRAALEVSAA